ncbi:MAG: FAD-dependent oxidoreductase [Eubacteriales bacterium]|nr:FAD-dependent oxidoreductase [Eubacteriales bacterium]
MIHINIELNISRNINTDVLVIGGGTSGVFSAISSAMAGAKTVLVEKNSMLGGTVTVANVNFPGLFFAWGKQIINGPCWEAIERVIKLGGATMPDITFKPEKHWYEQIRINRFIYTAVLCEMCQEVGVNTLLNAMITKIEETATGIICYITEKSGITAIYAKKVVDATGDANVIQAGGYPIIKSKTQQPATPQNHISGYNMENVSLSEINSFFKKADFPVYITAEKLISYLRINKIDVHIPCENADTSSGKTKVEFNSLSLLLKIYKFYRQIRGLENIYIDFIAEETGIRETNRIVGENIITAEDYITGITYKDSICYAFYPIDLHVMSGIEKKYHKENIVAKIPYSALIPKNSKHILCAGRCISSDTYANSAIRVQSVCMATGQVAGCAAALSAQKDLFVKDIPYEELCETLKSINAIIPPVVK